VWQVLDGGHELARVEVRAGSAELAPSQHAPRFGVLVTTQALVVRLQGGRSVTRWSWNADAHPLSH
jgi:hypothetical protein